MLRHDSPSGPPVAGRWVVLHQVNAAGGGPIDSTRTDAGGRWRLRAAHVDSMAIYVASALYAGLAYFSSPLHVVAGRITAAAALVVYDTSSAGPPVRVRRRFVTIAGAKSDGSRDVLEILELQNPGRATRIAPDTLQPTWAGAIPAAALDFEMQQSDFSADAVLRRGGDVLLFGPVQPDHTHQLSYRYVLSGEVHHFGFPVDQPTGELDLLLEDTLARVQAPGVRTGGVEAVEGRHFATYRVDSLDAGTTVSITFPAGRFRVESLLPVLIVLIALVLGAGLWVALRRGPQPSAVDRGPDPAPPPAER